MTEFEKWWGYQDQSLNKAIAEKAWHAAQYALMRTISSPPYIPQVGEKVRFLGLCHPTVLGKVKEVVGVEEEVLRVHWLDTKSDNGNGEVYYTCGVLSEVEPVSD